MTGFIGGVSVVVLLWIAVSADTGGSGSAADTPAVESSVPETVEYGGANPLCPNFDLDPYVDAIGMTPEVHAGSGGTDDLATVACLFESGDSSEPIRIHHLDIYAEISSSDSDAGANYEQVLDRNPVDSADMAAFDGQWDQAVTYQLDDRQVIILRDSNAVIRMGQSFDPVDALDSGEATELMVTYANQVLEGLRR